MKYLLWLIFFPAILCAHNYYGDVNPKHFSAKVEKAPSDVHLDEMGEVTVLVQCPKNYKLHNISHEVNEEEIAWSKSAQISEHLEQDKKNIQIKMQFDPKLSGEHYLNLPTLHLKNEDAAKEFQTLYPPLVAIHVKDCKENIDQLLMTKGALSLDLRRPIEMDSTNGEELVKETKKQLEKLSALTPNSFEQWVRRSLIALMLGFLALILVRWLKKKGWVRSYTRPTPDPRKLALEELQALHDQMLVQKGYFEEFYVRLTKIVRTYIERRFEIKAPEQTTQEFLKEALEKNLFDPQMNEHLREFLQFADLVKFARLSPLPDECAQAEKAAYQFIEYDVSASTDETAAPESDDWTAVDARS